jgi:hypothetical protein
MSDLPAKPPTPGAAATRGLDRAALERVLARAAELQGADADPTDALSEQQLLDIAREVGIAPDAVRVALAEERTRVTLPPETGLAARIAGPALIGASRTVKGNVAGVLATLDDWMRRGECMQPRRRQTDRLSWEPRQDMLGRMKVGLNLGGRGYHLARAQEVAATAVALDAERVHVQLVADVGGARRARLMGGGAVAGAGALTGGGIMSLLLVAPDPAIAVISAAAALVAGAGAFGGRAVARTHLVTARRVQVGLEQLLDRLEHGELQPPTDPRQLLTGLIQDALKPRRPL